MVLYRLAKNSSCALLLLILGTKRHREQIFVVRVPRYTSDLFFAGLFTGLPEQRHEVEIVFRLSQVAIICLICVFYVEK